MKAAFFKIGFFLVLLSGIAALNPFLFPGYSEHTSSSRSFFELFIGETDRFENLDEIVALIRKATNPSEAQEQLIAKFVFSEVQAKAILEMRLQRLTGLEREKIVSDYNETMATIAELNAILSDENKVLTIIGKELEEVRKNFGDARRTEFIDEQEEMTQEDYILEEEMVVTVTYSGYVKRLSVDAYRSQRRGGKGSIGVSTKAEDFIADIFVATTHDNILCFTDQGS